jgi:hypothetical protein
MLDGRELLTTSVGSDAVLSMRAGETKCCDGDEAGVVFAACRHAERKLMLKSRWLQRRRRSAVDDDQAREPAGSLKSSTCVDSVLLWE